MINLTDVKKVVVVKLGNPKEINQDLLDICCNEAIQKIRNYCSIDEIPMGLFYTLTNIVRDLYLFYNSSYLANEEGSGSDQPSGTISIDDISSIKMGDTTIQLQDGATITTPLLKRDFSELHNYNIDSIFQTYSDELNEYRRMVW